jgi:hypothetical protein
MMGSGYANSDWVPRGPALLLLHTLQAEQLAFQ